MKQRLTLTDTQELRQRLSLIFHTQGEDGEVVATASDGQAVSLGNILHGAASLLSYLRTHPTPDTW
jgi:hypothetical protein